MTRGYRYDEPRCPYCGGEADAEYADVAVGMVQVTPHVCEAVEIGPYDRPKELTTRERDTGWYEPR